MNDYVVGSVADVISSKVIREVRSKKSKVKLKNNDQCQNRMATPESKCDGSNSSEIKTKKKRKTALINLSEENPFQNGEPNVTSKENITNASLAVKKISKSKKTKKFMELDSEEKLSEKISETDFSEQGHMLYRQKCDSPKNNSTSVSVFIKKKSKSKKRKKANAVDSEEVIKQKRLKMDLLEENHMPSDSENDEDKNIKKNAGQIKSAKKKQPDIKILDESTVFIGNIPINYDKQKICKTFSKFGEIQNARIRCVPLGDINMSKKVAAIKKKFNPKRNSLIAYVNFKSLDSAKAAVAANGMLIDGHHVRVDFANSTKERDNNKAVFVGGLPFDIEDDELWEFFQTCGTINSVRIIRDSQTSMGKGFGYVNFDSSAAVELALQLNGQELKKRAINIKRCISAKKKNKLNTFNHGKSKEMANQLLCKRGKKFKEEKKKLKKEKKLTVDFQGRMANIKQKKKKKLSKAALHQRKLMKIFSAS